MLRSRLASIAGLLLVGAASSQAAWFTNEAAFLLAINSPYYYEDFAGIPSGPLGGPFNGSDNGFNLNADAVQGLWGLSGPALSTVSESDPIAFDFTGSTSAVTAFGGYFWNTNTPGDAIAGTVTLTLTGVGSQTLNYTSSPFTPMFLGWVGTQVLSGGSLLSSGGTENYATMDNVYTANAVNAVPEPFTMGLGIAAAGAFVRRRMKAKSA